MSRRDGVTSHQKRQVTPAESLERAADVVEDLGDLRAKDNESANNNDGHQSDDKGVLDEALATSAAEREFLHSDVLQTTV